MTEKLDCWAILELMGHRRIAGRVSEYEVGGAVLLRVDVPDGDGSTTQFYGPAAIYCLTPTTEETARAFAETSRPEPVHPWELKAIPASVEQDSDDEEQPF